MTLRSITALFCLLICLPLWSQSEIKGRVVDKDNMDGLYCAVVRITDENNKQLTGCTTDKDGNFVITSQLPDGNYQAVISFMGYKTMKVHFSLKEDEHFDMGVVVMDFDFDWVDYQLTWSYYMYPPFIVGSGKIIHYYDHEQLKHGVDPSDPVRNLSSLSSSFIIE